MSKLILALVLAAMMIVGSISAIAATGTGTNLNWNSEITISGLDAGDKVTVYKVLEWNADDPNGWVWANGVVPTSIADSATVLTTIIGTSDGNGQITSDTAGKIAAAKGTAVITEDDVTGTSWNSKTDGSIDELAPGMYMVIVSMQYEWVHKYLYPTPLYSFAMRFVQGGLYFKSYGMPIFGNPYRSNHYIYVNVNGSFEKVGILDSSFASYIIMRGMFWLTYTLAWLSYAIYKALKRRDYAIPFLTAIILVFAMMERPGLEMWYCFILLYPLAKVVNDPLERVAAADTEASATPAVPETGTEEANAPLSDSVDTGTDEGSESPIDGTIE